jgi:hypothetical protein
MPFFSAACSARRHRRSRLEARSSAQHRPVPGLLRRAETVEGRVAQLSLARRHLLRGPGHALRVPRAGLGAGDALAGIRRLLWPFSTAARRFSAGASRPWMKGTSSRCLRGHGNRSCRRTSTRSGSRSHRAVPDPGRRQRLAADGNRERIVCAAVLARAESNRPPRAILAAVSMDHGRRHRRRYALPATHARLAHRLFPARQFFFFSPGVIVVRTDMDPATLPVPPKEGAGDEREKCASHGRYRFAYYRASIAARASASACAVDRPANAGRSRGSSLRSLTASRSQSTSTCWKRYSGRHATSLAARRASIRERAPRSCHRASRR